MFDFLKPTRILDKKHSKYNGDILVKRSWGLGTYIEVGGLTQSGGILNIIWNSTLKRIKNISINNCLVLGLGGGTVVKYLARYWPKANITGVDIDSVIVEMGQKYLGLESKNLKIKITDATKFKSTGYDLVVIDTYCGHKYPKYFESDVFLKKIIRNKMVVLNRLQKDNFSQKLEKYFSKVELYKPEADFMYFCSN